MTEPEFNDDLEYNYIKIVGRNDFSDQFRKITIRYKRTGNMKVMRQSECLVVTTVTVNYFSSLFNCSPAGYFNSYEPQHTRGRGLRPASTGLRPSILLLTISMRCLWCGYNYYCLSASCLSSSFCLLCIGSHGGQLQGKSCHLGFPLVLYLVLSLVYFLFWCLAGCRGW